MEDLEPPRRIGRPCVTCTSAYLAEINAAMRDGQTLASISRLTGIRKQSLSRHRRNHLAMFESFEK